MTCPASQAGADSGRWTTFGACQARVPSWRPDGQALAFVATPHPYGYQVLFDPATWNARRTGALPHARSDAGAQRGHGADGPTIYVQARQSSIAERLYSISVREGALRQLTHGLAHHQA